VKVFLQIKLNKVQKLATRFNCYIKRLFHIPYTTTTMNSNYGPQLEYYTGKQSFIMGPVTARALVEAITQKKGGD